MRKLRCPAHRACAVVLLAAVWLLDAGAVRCACANDAVCAVLAAFAHSFVRGLYCAGSSAGAGASASAAGGSPPAQARSPPATPSALERMESAGRSMMNFFSKGSKSLFGSSSSSTSGGSGAGGSGGSGAGAGQKQPTVPASNPDAF